MDQTDCRNHNHQNAGPRFVIDQAPAAQKLGEANKRDETGYKYADRSQDPGSGQAIFIGTHSGRAGKPAK
jgi:hypothetical protein